MTETQIHAFNLLYLVMTIVVALLTRATPRRLAGAFAGATAAGVVVLGSVSLGERMGWWHFVMPDGPWFRALLLLDCVLCAYVFLLTWRIARRFGRPGMITVLLVLAVLGPVRDAAYMRHFPDWGSYGPGITPYLAISATYVLFILTGQGVMKLVAGPAANDPLARRPWEPRGASIGA